MANRQTPPFRADHVGSLLRPPALLRARDEFAAGRLSADELRTVEDEAIEDAVRMQHDIGLASATDGEFRRGSWHMDFLYQFGGITKVQDNLKVQFRNDRGTLEFTPAALHVDGPIRLDETIFRDDFEFTRRAAEKFSMTPKLTIPAPSMVHYRGGRAAIDEAVYPSIDQFWADLGAAYAAEVTALGELGCTYLQLDDTSLAYLNDPRQREEIGRLGGDPETQHLQYIEVANAAIAGKTPGMTITTHLCRGNFRSSWVAEGSYDYVAEALFNELNVDAFFLEFDDERSGGFEPLRFVPRDKLVVLGLVTSKRGELENPDDLKRRIEEAARYVDLDQLCLSPQCGFSSTVNGNDLTHEQQRAKLRLVVDTAAQVWG